MALSRLMARTRRRVSDGSLDDIPGFARDVWVAAASLMFDLSRSAEPVWSQDWDVLCILDGCRLDLMREVAAREGCELISTPDEVEALWSVGSQSAEWMDRTFSAEFREEMARTAYLTGNPFSAQNGDTVATVNNDVLPLDDGDFAVLYEAWRDEWEHGDISTIPPEPLTDAAIATWRRRDALGVDRIIVHYMQPHTPFRSRPDWFLGQADTEGWGRIDSGPDSDDEDEDEELPDDLAESTLEELRILEEAETDEFSDPWTRVRDQDLPFYEFWDAYRNNLTWVLDDVRRLVDNCDGRIALSSDHGNGLGEFNVWSHPPGVAIPAVRRVPWVPLEGRDRGTHRPELPDGVVDSDTDTEDGIDERLAALGYR